MEGDAIQLVLLDAFTDRPFTGNPAGVVLDARDLDDAQMQSVASEVQASACAFVLGGDGVEFRMRFFTPVSEVDLCAHAATAAFSALAKVGQIPVREEPVTVSLSTKAGKLPVELRPHPSLMVEVTLTLAPPRFAPFGYSLDLLAGILGVERYQIQDSAPLGLAYAGRWTLVVPVSTRQDLDAVSPDYESLARLNLKAGADGTLVYSWQGPADLRCRGFCPAAGVPEDPVTGEAMGAAAALVVREAAIALTPPLTRLTGEQGNKIGRRGKAEIEVAHGSCGVSQVRLTGTAVEVMQGRMHLPPAAIIPG